MSHSTSSHSLFALLERLRPEPGSWSDRAIVAVVASLVLLPLLGSFGLWDPWETHYGEVGRQIVERNDWISTWWGSHWQDAGGAKEGSFFYSKPILLMWLMAMGLSVFGFSAFAIRIGVALVAILGIILVFEAGKGVWSRRVGFLMALVLGTSPFWFFLSRQAQTDMPFVGLMSVGLCFFMIGAFGKDRDQPADPTQDSQAEALVNRLARQGDLGAADLVRAAAGGRDAFTDHIAARLTGLETADWRRALTRSPLRACLLCARATALPGAEAAAFHQALAEYGRVHALTPDQLATACEEIYTAYARDEARRALHRLGAGASIH
jgi:hypothetical protein